MKQLKATVRRMFHKVGYDVRALRYANIEECAVRSLLNATRPAAVLDVGANIGQFHDLLRNEGYGGLIISFEPLAGAHAHLVKRAEKDGNWRIAPIAALGSEAGQVDINVAENAVSSSLLPMNEVHRKAAPQSHYVGRQKVRVERLDRLAAGMIPKTGPLYLKIDTQGYEKEVLKGSTGIIERIAGMQLELSISALYAGAPKLPEMLAYASSHGFELYNVIPGFKDVTTGQVHQLEGFFIRRNPSDPNVF